MRHIALRTLALGVLIAALATFAAYDAHAATSVQHSATGHCKVVGKGTLWHYKGQKGTAYTIVGDRPTACAVGLKWLLRLTNTSGVTKTPPGWQCIAAVSVAGQCEKKSGGVFEWTAKTR